MLVTDLQYVAPDIVSKGPAQAMQDVQHLLLLEHGEQAVKKDLEPDRYGLGAIQHQAADVKHHIGLNDLHLGWVVEVLGAELVQSCMDEWATRGERQEGNTHKERQADTVNDYQVSLSSQICLRKLLQSQHPLIVTYLPDKSNDINVIICHSFNLI